VVNRSTTASYSRQGFTLVELSIVLVIIGLIVGGVLVGRDLIQAASIRSQVGQLEKYKSAVNTFRAKYNGVPGDILPAIATTFGLFGLSNPNGGQGMGDNNGIIEDGFLIGGGSNTNHFGGEIPVFWRHLSDANLVDGQFGTTGNAVPQATNGIVTGAITNPTQSIPQGKLRGIAVTVMSSAGTSYYALLPITGMDVSGNYTMGTAGVSPIEASNIDSKIDDGQPVTGSVLALGLQHPRNPTGSSPATLIDGRAPSANGSSTLNTCVIGTGSATTDIYNLVPSTGGNDLSCALAIRFQ
jgi:prepilin-type N-terminal cleavage/methylation domain-containing protein